MSLIKYAVLRINTAFYTVDPADVTKILNPLLGNYKIHISEVFTDSTSNYCTLLGTSKKPYWEWMNHSGGTIYHATNPPSAYAINMYVVIPGTPIKSPSPKTKY